MKIKFIPETHQYFLGKKELTSITTLLKRHGLATDFSEVMISPSVLADARDRGNLIHKEVEEYIKENKQPTTKEAKQIIEWYNSQPNQKSDIESEKIIHNGEFVGTKDLSFRTIMVRTLADIKTGQNIDKDACSWQLSLYEYLDKVEYDRLYVLHTPKDADLKIVEVPRIPKEEIERLLECDRNCEIYQPKTVELATVNAEISTKISQAIQTIEKLEEVVKLFKEAVLSEMQLKGIKKFDNGEISITYIEPTTRVSIDSKKLKEELPDVYKKYSKESEVKASIKIKGVKWKK
jgi:hypothetical protein